MFPKADIHPIVFEDIYEKIDKPIEGSAIKANCNLERSTFLKNVRPSK
jgi:hypothetical protein